MSNKNENIRGVIWTRVSSKKQKDNGGSLENQLNVCRRFAQQRGIEIVKEYGKTNESAKVQGKLFKEMIADVKRVRPHIEYIIIYSSDRFGRNGAESMKTADELMRLGINVIAATQEIDARTIQGKLMRNLNFVLAEFDNDVRREKCTAGMRAKLEAGIWCGKTPLGYYSQGRGRHTQFFINKDGELLRKAFKMKLQNAKNCKILEWLSNRGMTISKQQLHKIFTNPFYAGKITHKALGSTIIDGNHPLLITWNEFTRIQDILSDKTGRYIHEKESPKFPLLKHVFCAQDHTAFTKYTNKKKNIDYYKCNVIGCCTNHNAKDMHRKYAELLNEFALPKELLPIFEKIITDVLIASNSEQAKEKTLLTKNLSEVSAKIKRVRIKRATDEIDDEIYQDAMAEFNERKIKIEAELEMCNTNLSNLVSLAHDVALTCCKLGNMWCNSTLDICQKIQYLVFPKGVEWDKSIQNYRTIEANETLNIIRKLSEDYKNIKRDESPENTIRPLMCG